MYDLLYNGKLSREKKFTNFKVLEPPAKVFTLESFPLYGIVASTHRIL